MGIPRRGINNLTGPRLRKNNGEFVPGNKKRAGRKAGTPNRLPATLKELCMEAIAILGRDGKGADGARGYLVRVADEQMGMMVRLLEKILPTQVTGANGGAIKISALPPEILASLPDAELAIVEAIYARLQAGTTAVPSAQGNENVYAATLNGADTGTKH